MAAFEPAYIQTARKGLLSQKTADARSRLNHCTLCPRKCGINRMAGETGVCRTGELAVVAAAHPHFGEEPPLVGDVGSGTIFFTHCSLTCAFCQNYEISHEGWGREVSDAALAALMISLQDKGCANINLVTPTHVIPQILSALSFAIDMGLRVPLVYNSGGYDATDSLKLLEGVVDIYMPDFKFWDSAIAARSCDAPDYPESARQAIGEMHRQVGDLTIDECGLARRGLLVRHLVLPDGLAGTLEVMRFIHDQISPGTYVNIMSQYRPCGRAGEIPGLERPVTVSEFKEALQMARTAGLGRFDQF